MLDLTSINSSSSQKSNACLYLIVDAFYTTEQVKGHTYYRLLYQFCRIKKDGTPYRPWKMFSLLDDDTKWFIEQLHNTTIPEGKISFDRLANIIVNDVRAHEYNCYIDFDCGFKRYIKSIKPPIKNTLIHRDWKTARWNPDQAINRFPQLKIRDNELRKQYPEIKSKEAMIADLTKTFGNVVLLPQDRDLALIPEGYYPIFWNPFVALYFEKLRQSFITAYGTIDIGLSFDTLKNIIDDYEHTIEEYNTVRDARKVKNLIDDVI